MKRCTCGCTVFIIGKDEDYYDCLKCRKKTTNRYLPEQAAQFLCQTASALREIGSLTGMTQLPLVDRVHRIAAQMLDVLEGRVTR